MAGNCWCGQALKVEDANVSRSHLRMLSMFSGLVAYLVEVVRLACRCGQEHRLVVFVAPFIHRHIAKQFRWKNACPTDGKLCDRIPKSSIDSWQR